MTRLPLVAVAAAVVLGCDDHAPGESPREQARAAALRYDAESFAEQALSYVALGNYEQASITARRAVQSDPESAAAQNALAWAAMGEGNRVVQLVAALEAVRLEPENAAYRRTAGLVFLNTDRLDDAVEQFREAVRLNPQDMLSWRDLGRVAHRTGRWALADSAFDALAGLAPAYFDTAAADARRRDEAARGAAASS